jgi:hypothetical protein
MLYASVTIFAQNIEIIRPKGTHPINDSVIVVYGSVTDSAIFTPPQVINTGALSITLKVRRIDTAIVTGTQNYFCWGLCYGPQAAPVWVGSTPQTLPAGDTNKTFTADYEPHVKAGTSVIRYVFFNTSNPNDSAWVLVKFIIAPLSINEVTANTIHISAPYPNPAHNNVSFNYKLNGVQQASLQVYNTLGQCMETLAVNANNDKLSLNVGNLPSGIYICKFEANGAEPVYQRMVVSH